MISGRRVLQLSKWEILKAWKRTTPKSLAASTVLAGAVSAYVLLFSSSGLQVTSGLYLVGVSVDDYNQALQREPRLSVKPFDDEGVALSLLRSGDLDVVVGDGIVYFDGSRDKSVAAASVFEEAWRGY
ncbi:MAG: hypothetical protein ACE5Q6_26585, partial [Dehalococcoidia bacterium]